MRGICFARVAGTRLRVACSASSAPADDRFVQYAPETGGAPSERTTVQVCYDDKAVYVAVRAWDREPSGIVTRLARRDRVVEGDRIELLLDTRHDHHSGFLFLLTAAGGQADGFVANDGDFSTDWDAVWEGRTARDADGWTAEFAVPLAAVRFESEPEQLWGMQILRYLSRRRESAVWSAIPRDRQALVSPLHHIQLGQLRPRRTFAALPFLLLRAEARGGGDTWLGLGDDDAEHDPGLSAGVDLKLGLTRALTLDASILPDFGQIEADEVVLNLSRFETFFPEKRPFFLEGADLFATPIQLFYSRRIGRAAEDGGSVPIWAATKVTGTARAAGMGVLAAVTGPEDDVGPAQGFAVARARRDHDAFAQPPSSDWAKAS